MKMFYLLLVAYIISFMQVNLTGGGEQFLLEQAQSGSHAPIMWVTAMMLLHFGFPLSAFHPVCRVGVLFLHWSPVDYWGRLLVCWEWNMGLLSRRMSVM